MSSQLEQERYWRAAEIKQREGEIMARWQELLSLLEVHRDRLERYCTLINLQREIETLDTTIMLLHQEMESTEPGIHLLDVQEKLQKFQLQESQVNAMAETIKKVGKQSKAAMNSSNHEVNQTQLKMIESKMAELEDHFKSLSNLVKKRQALLEDSLSFFQLMQDLEEEGQWCDERLAVCQASITAKDLRGLTSLQQRHKAGEDEMIRRHNRSVRNCALNLFTDQLVIRFVTGSLATCKEMISSGHTLSNQLQDKMKQVQNKWDLLKDEVTS